MKYLPRIEEGSDLKGSGYGGADRGAVIVKRLGVSGTLRGEPGWDAVTGDDLWPFPNEEEIRTLMRPYALHGVNGRRGFCADQQTLSRYIWEYVGRAFPAQN